MLRLRLFLVVVVVAGMCMWWGGQKAYVAATNRSPARMTCAAYLANRPSATWVELTDCMLDYEHAIALENEKTHESKGVFVPVLPVGTSGRAQLVLELKEGDVPGRIEVTKSAYEAQKPFPIHGEPVKGMIRFGIDGAESKLQTAIKDFASGGSLANNFAIVKNDDKPGESDLLLGSSAAIFPPALAALILRSKMKKRRAANPPSVPGMIR